MGRRKYEALVFGAPGAAEYSAGAADAPQPHHGGTKVHGVYSCCDNGGELGFALLERSSELVAIPAESYRCFYTALAPLQSPQPVEYHQSLAHRFFICPLSVFERHHLCLLYGHACRPSTLQNTDNVSDSIRRTGQ